MSPDPTQRLTVDLHLARMQLAAYRWQTRVTAEEVLPEDPWLQYHHRLTLRAIVIGVFSLAFHGWGFDAGCPRAMVAAVLDHIRSHGPPHPARSAGTVIPRRSGAAAQVFSLMMRWSQANYQMLYKAVKPVIWKKHVWTFTCIRMFSISTRAISPECRGATGARIHGRLLAAFPRWTGTGG